MIIEQLLFIFIDTIFKISSVNISCHFLIIYSFPILFSITMQIKFLTNNFSINL